MFSEAMQRNMTLRELEHYNELGEVSHYRLTSSLCNIVGYIRNAIEDAWITGFNGGDYHQADMIACETISSITKKVK